MIMQAGCIICRATVGSDLRAAVLEPRSAGNLGEIVTPRTLEPGSIGFRAWQAVGSRLAVVGSRARGWVVVVWCAGVLGFRCWAHGVLDVELLGGSYAV